MIDKLGPVIRFHRRQAGLTRKQLARLAGVGKTVVFDIEKGKETVRLDTLMKVLHALNIRIDWTSPLREDFLKAKGQGVEREGW